MQYVYTIRKIQENWITSHGRSSRTAFLLSLIFPIFEQDKRCPFFLSVIILSFNRMLCSSYIERRKKTEWMNDGTKEPTTTMSFPLIFRLFNEARYYILITFFKMNNFYFLIMKNFQTTKYYSIIQILEHMLVWVWVFCVI